MHDPHEPQYRVRPEDLATHKQLISISDTYEIMEKTWEEIKRSLRYPWQL